MDSTINKNIWDNSLWTHNEDLNNDNAIDHYAIHFDKLNERAKILDDGNFLFNSQLLENSKSDYLNHLINYKIPRFELFKNFYLNNYAQKITKLKGYVTSIKSDYFTAKLYEHDNETYEIGEFDLTDVDKDDYDLLCIGGVFYWNFGYFVYNGQVKKQSEIRFQRLPNLKSEDLDRIFDEAKDLNKSLDWD